MAIEFQGLFLVNEFQGFAGALRRTLMRNYDIPFERLSIVPMAFKLDFHQLILILPPCLKVDTNVIGGQTDRPTSPIFGPALLVFGLKPGPTPAHF